VSVIELAVGWTDNAATTVLVGGLVFAALVEVPEASGRRCLRAAAALFAAALVLEIVANTVRMHRVSGIGGETLLADVLEMKWTRWWALRGLAFVVLWMGIGRARPRWGFLAAVGIASLLARSLQGHAGAHGLFPAMMDWTHLSAAAVWVGGLVQLAVHPSIPATLAARASRMFTLALLFLVVAGVCGAALHVSALEQLVVAPWGRVLLGKITLALAAILLGATNHYRRVPALVCGKADGKAVTRVVRVEVAVLAVVLLLSAVLGSLPMPHATAP
jgi:putative copper export protein